MAGNELTGIERQLVLQYLIDGNTPITVSPAEKKSSDGKVHADSSRIFPVAVRAEQMTVLDQGIILLKDAPESVQQFINTDVRVQFYFNKLGLYFVTKLKRVSSGPAIVIPSAIQRVTDIPVEQKHDMSAVLYYEVGKTTGGLHIDGEFDEAYPLFSEPKWSDVPEADMLVAKNYLERLGNDVYLIPVCRYLAHEEIDTAALQGTLHAPVVLYLNHERIVFGADAVSMRLGEGAEYALKLGFPLPKPLRQREVYVTCVVEHMYCSDDGKRKCAVCKYTSIKEEDARYIYDL